MKLHQETDIYEFVWLKYQTEELLKWISDLKLFGCNDP